MGHNIRFLSKYPYNILKFSKLGKDVIARSYTKYVMYYLNYVKPN